MAFRYYLVTFDLVNSKGRESEYAVARRALEFLVGKTHYFRIVMQCSLIRTDRHNALALKNSLSQRLGAQSNILVVRLRHGYALKLLNQQKSNAAHEFLKEIPTSG
jgi:hypothetical protein